MDLHPTAEQEEIVAAATAILAKELPISRIREQRRNPSSLDHRAWLTCARLGWFGLGLPETLGGVGYNLAEETLLFRELGRSLAPGPFLATTIGARVAALAGDTDLAAAAMAGDVVIGWAEPHDRNALVGPEVTGTFDVIDAVGASHLVGVTPAGAALIAMDDVGAVPALQCIDPAVRLGQVELDGVPAAVHLAGPDVCVRASVLAASMLVGIARATRDMAVDYAKERVQFGKPIGVHQAIKHRCSDMAVRSEAAGSLVLFAALSVDESHTDAPFQVASAKVIATDAAIRNAADNIQIHGGLGYTFEHDAHLYLKRAHVLDRIAGDARRHLHQLIDLPPAQ